MAPGSEFIGHSIGELNFARRFHAVIVGLWRRDEYIAPRLSDARLRESDLLVLWGRPSRFAELASHHGFLMLVPFAGEARRRVRAPIACWLTPSPSAITATSRHSGIERSNSARYVPATRSDTRFDVKDSRNGRNASNRSEMSASCVASI